MKLNAKKTSHLSKRNGNCRWAEGASSFVFCETFMSFCLKTALIRIENSAKLTDGKQPGCCSFACTTHLPRSPPTPIPAPAHALPLVSHRSVVIVAVLLVDITGFVVVLSHQIGIESEKIPATESNLQLTRSPFPAMKYQLFYELLRILQLTCSLPPRVPPVYAMMDDEPACRSYNCFFSASPTRQSSISSLSTFVSSMR